MTTAANRPTLTADLVTSDRASTTVVISCDTPAGTTARLEYTFKNKSHRNRAADFAAVIRDTRASTGAEAVVLLNDAAFDALAPLARGEMRFAAELISAFPA